MEQQTHTEQRVAQLREQFSVFPWILTVGESRDKYDIYVDLNTSYIEADEEIHTLENHGVVIGAISDHGTAGLRIYGNLR